jgi:hypothetical protein
MYVDLETYMREAAANPGVSDGVGCKSAKKGTCARRLLNLVCLVV